MSKKIYDFDVWDMPAKLVKSIDTASNPAQRNRKKCILTIMKDHEIYFKSRKIKTFIKENDRRGMSYYAKMTLSQLNAYLQHTHGCGITVNVKFNGDDTPYDVTTLPDSVLTKNQQEVKKFILSETKKIEEKWSEWMCWEGISTPFH